MDEVEGYEEQYCEEEYTKETGNTAPNLVFDHDKGITVKGDFQHPNGYGAAHYPTNVKVAMQGASEIEPPRISSCIFLPGPEQYMIVGMHQAEESQHGEESSYAENCDASCGLLHALPGMVFKANRHNRAQPGSNGCEHQNCQRGILTSKEFRHALANQLINTQIRNGIQAQEIVEEAPDYSANDGKVHSYQNCTRNQWMSILAPFQAKGPEVKNIGLPNGYDQNPTNVHITILRGIPSHDATRIHENPPQCIEDYKGKQHTYDATNGLRHFIFHNTAFQPHMILKVDHCPFAS